MRILICNDDGINSEGIIALALMLYKKGHEITVVAPEGNRSSYSHHVNFYTEIKMHKVDFAELMNRNGVYRDQEAEDEKNHLCRIEKIGKELIK